MAHLSKYSLMRIMASCIISSLSDWRLSFWNLIRQRSLKFASSTTVKVGSEAFLDVFFISGGHVNLPDRALKWTENNVQECLYTGCIKKN